MQETRSPLSCGYLNKLWISYELTYCPISAILRTTLVTSCLIVLLIDIINRPYFLQSVTQSTFANPCQVMTTPKAGINSGFHLTAPGTTQLASWSFTVDDPSTPLWFFCAQTVPVKYEFLFYSSHGMLPDRRFSHCQTGMVFAVNPTADKTFEAFQVNPSFATGLLSGHL